VVWVVFRLWREYTQARREGWRQELEEMREDLIERITTMLFHKPNLP
jgi:hypothetical protein